jgi:hypothetical protein
MYGDMLCFTTLSELSNKKAAGAPKEEGSVHNREYHKLMLLRGWYIEIIDCWLPIHRTSSASPVNKLHDLTVHSHILAGMWNICH